MVLCGDFNARPGSATHKTICEALSDIESFDSFPAKRTLFSPLPLSRVDHGFVSAELQCVGVSVMKSRMAKVASDHLPLTFDLQLDDGSSLQTSSQEKAGPTTPIQQGKDGSE